MSINTLAKTYPGEDAIEKASARLTALEGRFAALESTQALASNDAAQAELIANEALASVNGSSIGARLQAELQDGSATITSAITGLTTSTLTLTETYMGATVTTVLPGVITSGGGSAVPSFTVDNIVSYNGGTGWTFTARRTGDVSQAATKTAVLSSSINYPPGALASDFGGSFPSYPVNFLAGAATATFTVPANALVQPE